VENDFYGETSMFQRPYQAREVTQESQEVATARNIAAIVAMLIIPKIERLELDYCALSAALKTTLVGYLQGFCLPICAAWHINDSDMPIAVTRLAITLVFPENPVSFIKLIDGMIMSSAAFSNGVEAGQHDGELYRSTGRTGPALLQILASDFRAFCNCSEFVADAPHWPNPPKLRN
jgi:hypothetical protein